MAACQAKQDWCTFHPFVMGCVKVNCQPVTNLIQFKSTKLYRNMDNEKNLAEQTVRNYFKHLYDSNTDAILDLFIEDAVLMPADLPTTSGKTALAVAYNQMFGAMDFVSATTNYDEVSVYGDITIVRTTSDVNLFLIHEKQEIKSKMREFFILNKENEEWKISRYMFNREL
jgi:ketosteroid isomerase-like protein